MRTGIELIAIERKEQIEKHGYTIQEDVNRYEDFAPDTGDLAKAAISSIVGNRKEFPYSWTDSPFIDKICAKNYKDRLIVAGALIAAEIDLIIANEELAAQLALKHGDL